MLASSGSTRRPSTIEELIPARLAAALDGLDVASRRVFPGKLQGERRSKARGRSVEFEDYRPYVPGDDLRHIDWNVFARLDRFFIRIFQEEQDLGLHVALDVSPSMDAGTPAKVLTGQRIAMALAYLGLVHNNRVEVSIFSRRAKPGVARLGPLRGRTGVRQAAGFLLEQTFTRDAEPDTAAPTFSESLRAIARTRSGRGVMIVISDLLVPEGFRTGLALLADGAGGGGWDVTLLQVLSPGELDPLSERDGTGGQVLLGDLRLTDAETGRVAEVTVTSDLVKRYLARLEAHQKSVREFATTRGMQHVLVRSDADVATLLVDDLRRRGVLK
jgi:uncharacterized protein (DUF58 family)